MIGWIGSVAAGISGEPLRVTLGGEVGRYAVAQWKQDWPGCAFEDGIKEGRVSVVDQSGSRWLRVLYPQGSHGSDQGGAGWRMPVGKRNEAELSYTVCFEEGFDFNKGGKLPGLCGGPKTITGGDAVNGREGFSVRLMWRREGRGQAYVYHMDQPSKYGDEFDFPEGFRFPVGEPVGIRLWVRINTAGERDGSIRVWTRMADGKEQLQLDKTGLRFRQQADYAIDSVLFNTFHGGNDKSWGPARECTARFGGFELR